MRRRSFLSLSGASAVSLTVPKMSRAQNKTKRFDGITLRTNGYGGDATRIFRDLVVRPLHEETGLNVEIQDGAAAAAMAQVLASPTNPPFDFILADSPNIPTLMRAGMLAPVTAKEIPNIAKVRTSAREFGDFGVPYLTNAVVLTYNAKQVRAPLKSYRDLARPDLKDSVGLLSPENTGGILTLLGMAAAYGATLDNMKPVFDALRAMKGNIASATSSSVGLVQLLEQQEVLAAPIFDGRVYVMRAKGLPMPTVLPEEGIFALYNYLSPLKSSPHQEAVHAYINRVLSDEVIAEFVKIYRFAPVTDVPIRADVAKDITINAQTVKMLKPVDWPKVAALQGSLIEQFKKALQ